MKNLGKFIASLEFLQSPESDLLMRHIERLFKLKPTVKTLTYPVLLELRKPGEPRKSA